MNIVIIVGLEIHYIILNHYDSKFYDIYKKHISTFFWGCFYCAICSHFYLVIRILKVLKNQDYHFVVSLGNLVPIKDLVIIILFLEFCLLMK